MAEESPLDDLHRAAVKWDTAAWMETCGKIADPSGDIVDVEACNEFQREVSEIISYCHEVQRPCRIIILKPRRRGSSTVSVAAGYRRLIARRGTGCIAGGAHFQGKKLFKMMEVYADNDRADPGACKVLDTIGRFSNGSEMDRITLSNPSAGRAGGYQFLVVTEVAFLAKEGVADAAMVLSGLIKTVQFVPDTIIILESTANGATGDYYDRYNAGITFEEFKEGRNGFIRVFYPWFKFHDLRMPPDTEGIHSPEDYTPKERELAGRWKLDSEQVAWMRWSIREECSGSFDQFQQDYPFDDVSAFLKSGRGVFSTAGIQWQRQHALKTPSVTGLINDQSGRMGFVATSEDEAIWRRWEEPRVNRRYLVSVDNMTGSENVGGKDPDSHGVKVLRSGYLDNHGQWHMPALAMTLMLYNDNKSRGCWYNIDILADMIHLASRYYGNCIIVPESNMDKGLIEILKSKNAYIYKQERFNKRTHETTEIYGWKTDKLTRGLMITNLIKMIREAPTAQATQGIEVNCMDTIRELESFVRKESGREEAAQGAHDDQVMALAIGAQNLDYATAYIEPRSPESLPPELRKYLGERKRVRGEFSV